MRVLVAEDDERTADYLVRGLTESGHIADRVADGEAALAMALEGIHEALVLDRKLPGLDGLTVVRRLRQRDRGIPVLMLSGVATTADRVEGLRAGCDDYLAKPYSFSELLARLEALLRRTDRTRGNAVLRVGDLELDTVSRTVSRDTLSRSFSGTSPGKAPLRTRDPIHSFKVAAVSVTRLVRFGNPSIK